MFSFYLKISYLYRGFIFIIAFMFYIVPPSILCYVQSFRFYHHFHCCLYHRHRHFLRISVFLFIHIFGITVILY